MSTGEAGAVYTLPHGWTLHTVEQIRADERYSCVAGPFGSEISSKYSVAEGVPVIRGANLRDGDTYPVADSANAAADRRAADDRAAGGRRR